jgi:hypothetical protein
MRDEIKSGSVISYPYLWRWQRDAGREHGEKHRPVCVALALPDPRQNLTHLMLLPISATAPAADQLAIDIPLLELKRAGLSVFKCGWITVGEYNYDIAESSFYFEPGSELLGQFSPRFLEEIRQALRPVLAKREGRVDRTR